MEHEDSPCGPGYSLIGDICEPTPEGYVETRSRCEMGVDSMEAAGVEQDYAAEIAKCRNENPTGGSSGTEGSATTITAESDGWPTVEGLEILFEFLVSIPGQMLEGLISAFGV